MLFYFIFVFICLAKIQNDDVSDALITQFDSHRRKLDYPDYTIVSSGGYKWAYYTNTIMANNQYIIYKITGAADP